MIGDKRHAIFKYLLSTIVIVINMLAMKAGEKGNGKARQLVPVTNEDQHEAFLMASLRLTLIVHVDCCNNRYVKLLP